MAKYPWLPETFPDDFRYYLHGDLDQRPVQPGVDDSSAESARYYCHPCDSLKPSDHFGGPNDHSHGEDRESNLSRYRSHKTKTPARLLSTRPRSADSSSLFALASKPLVRRSRFFRWLLTRVDEDSLVGDLAGNAAEDRHFPVQSDDPREIYEYLRCATCNSGVFEAFQKAWREWKTSPGYVPLKQRGRSLPHSKTRKKSKANKDPGYVSSGLRYEVYERDKGRCQICGVVAGYDHDRDEYVQIEVDHIKPKCRGGSNEIDNLRVLCKKCNRGKGAREAF